MKQQLLNIFKKIKRILIQQIYKTISDIKRCKIKKSYSQCGEDLIIRTVFDSLSIKKPFYIDIEAHHPTYISNTALFYKKGCRGICVEPDPYLFRKFKSKRKKDICLNIGIGKKETLADFYIMSTRTLNTFSKEEAENCMKNNEDKIKKTIPVKLQPINDIIEKNCNTKPNFISLDTEGLDFEILKTFDFNKYRPEVFCIETLEYSTGKKSKEIIDYMEQRNYFVYADTYINTIFVDYNSWKNRNI
jgi:FkbM family methyltransferase